MSERHPPKRPRRAWRFPRPFVGATVPVIAVPVEIGTGRVGSAGRLSEGFGGEVLVRPNGFEPLTPRFVVWCSIQLSYGRMRREPIEAPRQRQAKRRRLLRPCAALAIKRTGLAAGRSKRSAGSILRLRGRGPLAQARGACRSKRSAGPFCPLCGRGALCKIPESAALALVPCGLGR